jgi:predicted CXXCH cytochrome family protein
VGLLAALAAAGPARAQRVPAPIEAQVCAECHPVDSLRASVHGTEIPCLSCHGVDSHREMPQDSAVAVRDRALVCAACHDDLQSTHSHVTEDAPICLDCHREHSDPAFADAAPQMARRCGACHERELFEFDFGAHAEAIALDQPNADLPSCETCHAAHDSAFVSRRGARLEATALCIRCHADQLLIGSHDLPELAAASYESDFHGSTLQFLWKHPEGADQPDVLICSDCHGAHAVEWQAREDVVAVCLECHEGANERIAGAWLGHDRVGPNNAVLIWSIRLFYFSFVPIVLGGLLLNIALDLRWQRQQLRSRVHTHKPAAGIGITRFSLMERIEHFLGMTTFTLLVITGLPQIWSQSAIGSVLIRMWGGIGPTRLIHRITGVLFVALLVLHVSKALIKAIRTRHLPIMFASRKDFTDTLQTVRQFLGLAAAPKVGKFDFRAKFEYWGLLMGGTLMSVTGFMLLFPETFSWIVPGGVIAAGRVLHGLEGTFAVLVVILWHSWSVILRPEIFPLDKSIFTGKIDLERLREEHALEYERIFGKQAPDEVEHPL